MNRVDSSHHMAWRLHDNVVRGEIDNRTKGMIAGRIWITGMVAPVELHLHGNAQADLAGCLLVFENPRPTVPLRPDAHFSLQQHGTAGDFTASNKVRVMDVPIEEVFDLLERGQMPPEHLANSLYLEWFSDQNGRVVIEGADWRIRVGEPAWTFTPEDEAERARNTAQGLTDFMQRLTAAVDDERRKKPDSTKEWDEFEWEQSLRESDAISRKYSELLDKFHDLPNASELIAREMGWDPEDVVEFSSLPSWVSETLEEESAQAPAALEQPDPKTEGVDWIRCEDGHLRHPLQDRCFRSAMRLWQECKSSGLLTTGEAGLVQLITEFQITSAKLAGALNGLARGHQVAEPGFIVACLKRALQHLHLAQQGLRSVKEKSLLTAETQTWITLEIFAIREEILALMKRFRGLGPPH